MAIPGVEQVEVKMDAEVPKARGTLDKAAIEGIKHIIAVSSGKGGVGKSTVAVNLAVSLAPDGRASRHPRHRRLRPERADHDRRQGHAEVRGEMIVPPVYHGVKTMSIGLLNPGDKAVVWRGPMLHSAVSQFLRQVEWGELDYLVVDMPPGTGDVQLSLAQIGPARRRGARDDAAGSRAGRRAQGLQHVRPAARAGPRHRREHELFRVPE